MLNQKKLFQKKYINLVTLAGIIIIVLLSALSYWQALRMNTASRWVTHSYEVIETTESMLSDISSAESNQRNYILTDDKSYLQVLNAIKMRINDNSEKLKNLVQDRPSQLSKSITFLTLTNVRLALLDYGIKLYDEKGLQGILAVISQNKIKYKQIITNVRKAGNEIITEEKQILVSRIDGMYLHAFMLNMLQSIVVMVSLGIILFCLWLLNKQLRLDREAEKQIQASEDELFRLAYYDTLTGLPNRTMLVNNIDQAIRDLDATEIISVLLIDIDHFKNINISLGHDVADEFLLLFSERLCNAVIDEKDIISRLGSDEFVILKAAARLEEVKAFADKIINSFREPVIVRSHKLFITVSVGISVYPDNGFDAKTLLKNADIAMYRTKELGRNNYQFCTTAMASEIKERALLDYDLHHAVQNDELILLYQPKISLKDGKVIGIEVLMRWNRPSVGLVLPENFIALAESNGFIVPLSEWLIRKACSQAKAWQMAGLPITNIAINVSTRQFSISDFSSHIKNILAETGFDPHFLEFEITERILMENSFDNFSALRALKKLGIKITIDDFGTEYSSLSYLRFFDIDKIKIDKSFVDEITEENQSSSIINAIIVMAHSLNITVVAEGVETETQAEVLKRYGCDEVQGFLYHHPLSANEIQKLLR